MKYSIGLSKKEAEKILKSFINSDEGKKYFPNMTLKEISINISDRGIYAKFEGKEKLSASTTGFTFDSKFGEAELRTIFNHQFIREKFRGLVKEAVNTNWVLVGVRIEVLHPENPSLIIDFEYSIDDATDFQ